MPGTDFYSSLPVHESIEEVLRDMAFHALPRDWWLVITDIEGSTSVIEVGGYRNVVTLGSATIIAALNVVGDVAVPFRFGGDGSVICVPDSVIDQVLASMAALQREAPQRFGLGIRCGAVNVGSLNDAGYEVSVGRYRLSKHNILAVFSGGGIDYADLIVKKRAAGECRYPEEAQDELALEGLECRWKPVKSNRGTFMNLIVVPAGAERMEQLSNLEEVLSALQKIYGKGQILNPVDVNELQLSLDTNDLQSEMRARVEPFSLWRRVQYLLFVRWIVLLGKFLMSFRITVDGFNWGEYPSELIENIDNRSYADIYSHVFPGSARQHQELLRVLDTLEGQGRIQFGTHESEHALFTCHITKYSGKHLHFLDGSDGGLTVAAKNMKEKSGRSLKVAATS